MTSLTYPLSNVLRKKKSLKRKLLAEDRSWIHKNIAILGGSTSAEIKNALELFLLNVGIKPEFYESEYNKYYEDALFTPSELLEFKPEIIYIHTSQVNIAHYPKLQDSHEMIAQDLQKELDKYQSIWRALAKFDCAIIQNNFDYPLDRSLGNLDAYDPHGKSNFINQLNQRFAEAAQEQKNLYINDINYLSAYMGLKNWFDRSLWYQAKYAMSMDAIPELAFNISKIIKAIFGKSSKCLVLDLDHTCWGGVIGDDGLNGIQIGTETAVAESFTAFQSYVRELKTRGITLAVCSKNDHSNAQEGFSHPDSILKYEDFTAFKANWEPKHQNIAQIAQDINIGLDSLVFIDDNPAERAIVSSQLASVAVPDVGSDVIRFIDYIDRNGYFETVSLSQDDLQRNQYYEDNKKRTEVEASFQSYDEFLQSLEMSAEIKTFSPLYLPRITQLTNKTNQFNLTTKRYSMGEIEQISTQPQYIKLYGKLSDKFGDNGLIAITIGRVEHKTCHIDLWLMSCRVLKRGMEFAMLDELVKQCQSQGIERLLGYYYKSAKNSMVADMYKSFGFSQVAPNEQVTQTHQDTIWQLDLSDYTVQSQHIKVN